MTELIPEDAVTYDLGYLDPAARAALLERLRAAGVEHVWDRSTLSVAGADDGIAFDLVAEAGVDERQFSARDLSTLAPPPPEEPLASGWRRLAGYLVDGYVVTFVGGVLLFATLQTHLDSPRSLSYRLSAFVVSGVATFLVIARPTARSGRSLGMLVVDTRLVAADTGRSPGYRRAILRWAPSLVLGLLGVVSPAHFVRPLVTLGGLLAIYLPIRLRVDHRGLHDVLAGTVVVRDGFHGVPPLPGRVA